MEPFDTHESNVRFYCRKFPVVFSKATGSTLITEDGKEYLDLFSGAGSLNYGHNHPRLKEALLRYINEDGLTQSLDLYSTAKRNFINAFERNILHKRKLFYKIQFTGPTGTNAVEAAIKLARKVTGRQTIAAFTNAYHGMTLGALAATGNGSARRNASISLPGVIRLPYDGYFGSETDTMAMIEKMLTDPSGGYDMPGAFLLELVQGEGGLNTASQRWYEDLCTLARQIGALVIVDDIQAGCGRTGTFFSFETFAPAPDIVCLSKSISGFGLPLSIVLMKPEWDIWKPGDHTGTFRGNNHAFVTGAKALECFWQDDTFEKQVYAKGKSLRNRLNEIAAEVPGVQIKGRGMMLGLSFPTPEQADAVAAQAFLRGLIVETCGPRDEVVKLLPALTIEEGEIQRAMSILREAVFTSCSSEKVPISIP